MKTQKEERYYSFSYTTRHGRTHTAIQAPSMEEAHQKGKENALKRYPDAHGFLTEQVMTAIRSKRNV